MTSRLRILFLVHQLLLGGAERQLADLARGLDRSRFDPLVLTLYPGGPLERELMDGGVPVLSLERRGKFDLSTLPKLARFLRREHVQIIQPYSSPATFFGLTAALLARTPVKVAMEHSGVRFNRGPFGTRFYRFLEGRLICLADAVIAVSVASRVNLLHGVRPDKIRVIYNGISQSRVVSTRDKSATLESLGIPRGAPIVGIAARLAPEKDHETLLRAAALIREHLPDTFFLIAGDGPLRPHLENVAERLGLGSHAVFLGNQADVASYIDCFDVAVLASCDIEACSIFLLEAMALSKPVVCTDVGGNRELITNGINGLLVPSKSPEALANAILKVLSDAPLGAAMAKAARQRFQDDFTSEDMVRRYEETYMELWFKSGRAGVDAARLAVANERGKG